uniref:Uncharacterized protein n=1 Tax=Acrobeloides nanus TaxID=290746 RepID=A0A914DCV4_9BILA
MACGIILKIEPSCIEIWNFEHQKTEEIAEWDQSLTNNLKLTTWVLLDESKIISAIEPLLPTRIQGSIIEVCVPYIKIKGEWEDHCTAELNEFIGYSPFLGQVASFFRMDVDSDKLYWVWAAKIPSNVEAFRNMMMNSDLHKCVWMAKKQNPEEVDLS